MNTAKVVCVVSLDVETFILSDGPDARLEKEALSLTRAREIATEAAKVDAAAQTKPLNAIEAPAPGRPLLVVRDIVPKEWSITYNSFRKADELEITFPFSMLPIPGSAIRNVVARAIVRQLTDEEYENGVMPSVTTQLIDFAGIGRKHSIEITNDAVPMVKIGFVDFAGILGSDKVKPGKDFDENLPISQMITKFLLGTWAEGMPVRWVDPRDSEPTLGKYKPKLHKSKQVKKTTGGASAAPPKATKEVSSQYSYLDAITIACSDVGVVPRILDSEIQLSYAGTMYAGLDRGGETKATMLVGQVIEAPIKTEHELLGQKFVSVQVVSYDPDTHRQYMARWPKDPKNGKATTIANGAKAVATPLVANLGRPGYQELDESILLIPVAPCSNPELLPKVAEAIFLERTRQRTVITLTTHSPWSNPFEQDPVPDLLRLRAGDNIVFGYLPDLAMPGEVKALSGQLEQGETQSLLQAAGLGVNDAAEIARVVALIPSSDRLRVDEVKISGSDSSDTVFEFKLVTFTVITSDLQAKADGIDPADLPNKIASFFVDAQTTVAETLAYLAKLRIAIDDSDATEAAKANSRENIRRYQRMVLKD